MRGGARKGAGRKPGVLGTLNREARELAAKAVEGGITPLEVMLKSMRKAWDEKKFDAAVTIATQAAPYVHPRLASVEQKIEADVRQRVSDKPITDDEWEAAYGNRMGPTAGSAEKPN